MPGENVGVVEGDGDLIQPLIYFLWAISNNSGCETKTIYPRKLTPFFM